MPRDGAHHQRGPSQTLGRIDPNRKEAETIAGIRNSIRRNETIRKSFFYIYISKLKHPLHVFIF